MSIYLNIYKSGAVTVSDTFGKSLDAFFSLFFVIIIVRRKRKLSLRNFGYGKEHEKKSLSRVFSGRREKVYLKHKEISVTLSVVLN